MFNRIKKKTVALVLASVITVAGSFAEDNYQNSIMNITIGKGNKGDLGILFETKVPYSKEITPTRIDSDTYVITLPEVNSVAPTPELKNGVVDFNIQTRPYTTNSKGYTRIKIKLSAPQEMFCLTRVYIEDQHKPKSIESNKTVRETEPQNVLDKVDADRIKQQNESIRPQAKTVEETKVKENIKENVKETEKDASQTESAVIQTQNNNYSTYNTQESNDYETLLLVFGILIICVMIALFIYKASNNMRDIAGTSYSDDDEVENEKKVAKKPKKTISGTIKKLDSKISKYGVVNKPVVQVKEIEKVDAVDLDKLFEEQLKEDVTPEAASDNHDDLEDFLAGFNFEEEDVELVEEPEIGYDAELYEKVINSKKILFDKSDISRINALLSNEIDENTIRNIEKYAVTSPIKDNPEKRIEDLIATFAVYQGVKFNERDMATLKQLSSIEIDSDFLTDLSVDKTRTETMVKEIKTERPVEVIPKEQPVLTVKDYLPDLSVEINNKISYASKPSAPIEYADKTYEVNVLKLDVDLPDLQDVLKNPKKYEEKPVPKAKVDENALLQGLSTVEFKPFDDGTREFEILNDFDDLKEDVKEELSISNVFPQNDNEVSIVEKKTQIEQRDVVKQQERKTVAPKKSAPVNSKMISAKEEKNLNCVFDGVSYSIISSIEYAEGIGFYLAKVGNGYAVLGYAGNNVNEIKHYNELINQGMNFRVNETLEDGTARCLLKVGFNKFVVDINGTSIKHVMDL